MTHPHPVSPAPTAAPDDSVQVAAPARPLFWLALGALALSVVTVIGMTAYSRHMEHWVQHTTRMYQTTRSGLLDVTGPLSRGDSASTPLSGIDAARAIARFDSVGDSTRDNPVQQVRIRAIRELAGQWSSALHDKPSAVAGLADAIDGKVRQFLAEEQRLYQVRSARFHRAQEATAITVTAELAFVAVMLVAYSRRIARDVAAANAQQQRLEEQAAELEEQALELEISNHELSEAVVRAEQQREIAESHGRQRDRVRALLDAALDSAPVAFALVDNDLHYLQVNARWTQLTGAERVDHIGRRFDELPFSNDALAGAIELVTSARETTTPTINVQLSGHGAANADTGLRHWLLSAVPVSSVIGSPDGLAIALLDVTDHTRTMTQFLHIQKMEAIGRLAGGIAHDFNNSLAVINAYASMLALSKDLPAIDRQRVGEITGAVQRAASLTEQLLTFGRRQITQPRRIDVAEQTRSMVPVLTRLVPASIQLDTRIDSPPADVLIDASQVEQIVLNLVTNAIHAMPQGGHLTIATELVDLDETYAGSHLDVVPGHYVMLTVSDTGIGMDESVARHIFEPFFTTKEPGKGTGLGLASVYAIVNDAGGNVSVKSEPGRGTELKVYLPVAGSAAPPAQQPAEGAVQRASI